MSVILTPELGTTTQERWEKETPFLIDDFGNHLDIRPETCLLDYGCGIGRLAKGAIDRYGCRVVGVDCSPAMRQLAPVHVHSERFTIASPLELEQLVNSGFRADMAICVWVLQHVLRPNGVIQQIANSLRPGGSVYALNSTRCVPTDRGWINDGYDVSEGLCRVFDEKYRYCLPANVTTPQIQANSVIQILRNSSTGKTRSAKDT